MAGLDQDLDTLHAALDRYVAAFGEPAPLVAWSGTDAELVELVGIAIREGRRLDEVDLARAMGIDPVPAGGLM